MDKRKIIRTTTVPLSMNLFCRGLLKELSDTYEVVAVTSPGAELDEIASREGVRTIGVEMKRQIALLHDLRSLVALYRVFRRERPYLVHSMTPKAGLLSMMAARAARVPVRVHTFTGLIFPYTSGLKQRVLLLTDRITCACATHVVAEGVGVKNDLENYHVTSKPVRVLGNGNVRGVDLDYYRRSNDVMARAEAVRREAGIDSDCFVYVFVGRIVPDKGMDELIHAFRRLEAEGRNVFLFLVGQEEDEDPLNEETKREMDASDRIKKTGWLDDVRPWYAAADVLIHPSYREGFPNVVLEAGAMELGSVVTDINGSREIIRDGENGLILPVHDEDTLYTTMRSLADNRHQAKQMAAEARKSIAERFEQSYVRHCLKEFYNSLGV